MLGLMTPEMFNERLAHYQVDPWGDDWAQTATVAKEIASQTQTYIEGKTGKPTPDSRRAKITDFIPIQRWLRARYDRERIRNNGSHRHHRG